MPSPINQRYPSPLPTNRQGSPLPTNRPGSPLPTNRPGSPSSTKRSESPGYQSPSPTKRSGSPGSEEVQKIEMGGDSTAEPTSPNTITSSPEVMSRRAYSVPTNLTALQSTDGPHIFGKERPTNIAQPKAQTPTSSPKTNPIKHPERPYIQPLQLGASLTSSTEPSPQIKTEKRANSAPASFNLKETTKETTADKINRLFQDQKDRDILLEILKELQDLEPRRNPGLAQVTQTAPFPDNESGSSSTLSDASTHQNPSGQQQSGWSDNTIRQLIKIKEIYAEKLEHHVIIDSLIKEVNEHASPHPSPQSPAVVGIEIPPFTLDFEGYNNGWPECPTHASKDTDYEPNLEALPKSMQSLSNLLETKFKDFETRVIGYKLIQHLHNKYEDPTQFCEKNQETQQFHLKHMSVQTNNEVREAVQAKSSGMNPKTFTDAFDKIIADLLIPSPTTQQSLQKKKHN